MLALEPIDPELGLSIIIWGGWALFASGMLHLIVWVIGEFRPAIYDKFRAKFIRTLFTGTANRLMFGAGGVVLVFLGAIFVFLGKLIGHFNFAS